MRENAGSAAAPAARCRNCLRWGSFILNLPFASHHSITSSARASKVAGTSRPSALAVLRLITNSNLVGACTGRSAGSHLEGCGRIDAGLPVHFEFVCAITDQLTGTHRITLGRN